MKVGILLGSFNPIHMGHLHMATSALNAGLVDEVVFVPSVQNPWKKKYSADFRNRCFMISLAIDDMENCSLSSIDYRNTEPYYSVNTLKMLQEEYPEDELYLIVGADIVNTIKDLLIERQYNVLLGPATAGYKYYIHAFIIYNEFVKEKKIKCYKFI